MNAAADRERWQAPASCFDDQGDLAFVAGLVRLDSRMGRLAITSRGDILAARDDQTCEAVESGVSGGGG